MKNLGLISLNLSEPFFLHPFPRHNFLRYFLDRIERFQNIDFVLSVERETPLPLFLKRFISIMNIPVVFRGIPQMTPRHVLEVLERFEGDILVDLSAWRPFVDIREAQRLVDLFQSGSDDYFVYNEPKGLLPDLFRRPALVYLNERENVKDPSETLRKSPLRAFTFNCPTEIPRKFRSLRFDLFVDNFYQLQVMEEILSQGSLPAWFAKNKEKATPGPEPRTGGCFFQDLTGIPGGPPNPEGTFIEDSSNYFTRQVHSKGRTMPYAFTPALDEPGRKPLIVLFHGWGGSGKYNLRRAVFKDWNILVPWDCNGFQRNGTYWLGENGDRITEILLLKTLAQIRAEHALTCPDIFAVGGSMGGFGALYHGIKQGWSAVYAFWPLVNLASWRHRDPALFEAIIGTGAGATEIPDAAAAAEQAEKLPPIYVISQRFDFVNPPESHLFRLLQVYNRRRGWYGLCIKPNIGHGQVPVAYDEDILPFFKAVLAQEHLKHNDRLKEYGNLLDQEEQT